ncbi:PP2C family protein-serine/threonine phosphatase [Candidatus Uabimicrobium sp. HlEnr_7]|uniref:PP2C family protein-serine/threonine phosphatase n=1 Tax=Candidatus Uabimicrobium helgolandensis TaxID=3095367 RepID=UPI0035582B0D
MSNEEEMHCMEVWGGNRDCDCHLQLMGLGVEVYSKPFAGCENGGDVYYVSSCATGRITRLMVADVSGHGEDAAHSANQLRQLMGKYVNFVDQSRVIEGMNDQFASIVKHGRFATAVIITYFAPTNEMIISNAGHPPPLLYRKKSKSWCFIDKNMIGEETGDIPLGILSGAHYHQCKIYLEPGDLVLCYTDSLIEMRKNSSVIGADGLLQFMQDIGKIHLPSAQILLEKLQQQTKSQFNDDVTVVTLAVEAAPRVNLKTKILIPFRMLWIVIRSLFSNRIITPQTEWSLRNLGGAFFHRLNFLGNKNKKNDAN